MLNITSGNNRSQGAEIIQSILAACGLLTIGKNMWQAIPFEEPSKIDGHEVKAIGVRIQRIKRVTPPPKTLFGKFVQNLVNALEPAIIIPPLYETAKPRCVAVEVEIGGRRFSSPNDSLLTYPLRKDLEKILKEVEQVLPGGQRKCSA